MEELCDETLRLVQHATQTNTLDLAYTIQGLNILSFYDLHCDDQASEGDGGSGGGAGPFYNNSVNGSTDQFKEEELYDPEYFSHTYRLVGTFFQGIVFLIGLLGNVMVVVVVARTKSMHSPTNCYLVSLALADIVVLLAAVPNEILSYYLIGGKWLYGEFGCSAFVFSQNLGINASTLSLTAFTVERYIAICHPMKAQTMCTVARAKRITAGVWLCSIVYCSPWWALTSLTPLPYKGFDNVQKCTFKLSREAYTYYYLTDFFVFYVVPLLLSVVLYSLIARILFQSQALKTNNQTRTTTTTTFGSHGHGHGGHGSGKNGCGPLPLRTVDSTKTNAARVQVVKMLIMVVIIFAVLWLPYRGMLVYNSFATMFGGETFMDLWFLMLVKTCIYINSAINPILYNAMSVKFRKSFSRTLFCGKARGGPSYRAGGYAGHYSRAHTNYSTATMITTPTNRLTPTDGDGALDSDTDISPAQTATLVVHSRDRLMSTSSGSGSGSRRLGEERDSFQLQPTNTTKQVMFSSGLRQNHSSKKRNNKMSSSSIEIDHAHAHPTSMSMSNTNTLNCHLQQERDYQNDKQVVTQL